MILGALRDLSDRITQEVYLVFSSLTTSVMLLAMVLHAAFGCHWHHAHAADGPGDSDGQSSAAHCPHHHPAHDMDGNAAPEVPCPEGEDCEDECIFLVIAQPAPPTLDVVWMGVDTVGFEADQSVWRAWNISERNRNNLFYGDTSPSAQRPILCVWLV